MKDEDVGSSFDQGFQDCHIYANQKWMQTYHSKAPKTVPACAILHAVPLHRSKPDINTAKAMKPANQNIMVMASMARIANL